jgi:hypothetical protein
MRQIAAALQINSQSFSDVIPAGKKIVLRTFRKLRKVCRHSAELLFRKNSME